MTKPNPKLRYYKLLPIAKLQLGWDEEFYRKIILKQYGAKQDAKGKYSASTMSLGQLMQAYEHCKSCGFKPTFKKGSTGNVQDWRAGRIKKITALWFALFDAGVVRDQSEAGMVAWCKAVTKKEKLQWYTSAELNKCIEGLKSWADRMNVKIKL